MLGYKVMADVDIGNLGLNFSDFFKFGIGHDTETLQYKRYQFISYGID